MQIDPNFLKLLQERYAYVEWQSARAESTDVQLREFRGDELPGFTLSRRSSREDDGARVTRGIWTSEGNAERVLDIEVISTASESVARERLLDLLGDMQGPVGTRLPTGAGIGDVAFTLGGESAIMFARGASVVRIRNAGRAIEGVSAQAKLIDAWVQQARR
jgi:hypothetical protein